MVPASGCVLVLWMAALASAQIPSIGFCPEYLPMAEFDMERFLGKWYEAERYFTFSEVASRCVVTDYARGPSGRIYVSNEVTNRITGVKRVIGGNLELAGKGNEGRMNVKYATTPISTETTLTVLDTDYDNFAVVWSCSGIGPFHAQNAWVMTRERLAPGAVLQHAYGVLDRFKISRTFFVKTDQEGCAIVASDINAANGITPSSTVPQATGAEQKVAAEEKDDPDYPEPSPKNAPKSDAEIVENIKIAEKEDSAEKKKVQPEQVAELIMNNAVQQSAEDNKQDVKDAQPQESSKLR